MTQLIDLTGKRFGRLVVLRRVWTGAAHTQWECLCDCGNKKIVQGPKLNSGWTKSCGCLQKEVAGAAQLKHGECRRVDGKRTVPKEYNSWASAKDRCTNVNSKIYRHYGGRGIKMCDEWMNDFGQFLKDMGQRPAGHSLERKDNNGNYEPGNCIWATPERQANNRRTNRLITVGGETMTLADWSRRIGVKQSTLGAWFRNGTGAKILEILLQDIKVLKEETA